MELGRDGQVRLGKLTERVKLLKWLWNQTASHPHETIMVPLADVLSGASPCGKVQFTPWNLTTMWSASGGFQLAVRVCHTFVEGVEGVIARPCAPADVLMGSAQWLQTTHAADQKWLAEDQGVAVPMGASAEHWRCMAQLVQDFVNQQ